MTIPKDRAHMETQTTPTPCQSLCRELGTQKKARHLPGSELNEVADVEAPGRAKLYGGAQRTL